MASAEDLCSNTPTKHQRQLPNLIN